MPVLIYDPLLEKRIRSERGDNPDADRYDEVWEGVLIVSPSPNNEHQDIVSDLVALFKSLVRRDRGDRVFAGVNVSDRVSGWKTNYREPDVAVYLASNGARDCRTHWAGGPDLAVEIASPGERPWDKLPFYAKVKTREMLILNRSPWELELYGLKGSELVRAGKSKPGQRSAILRSLALPIAFQLKSGKPKPAIVITHNETKQVWTI